MLRRGILVGVVALAISISGCGGGDEASVATKAEFTKRAETICREAAEAKGEAIEEAFARQNRIGKPFSRTGEERLFTQAALPPIARMSIELAELPTPADDSAARAVVDAFENAVAQGEADPQAVLAGEDKSFPQALAKAKAYGLRWCTEV